MERVVGLGLRTGNFVTKRLCFIFIEKETNNFINFKNTFCSGLPAREAYNVFITVKPDNNVDLSWAGD